MEPKRTPESLDAERERDRQSLERLEKLGLITRPELSGPLPKINPAPNHGISATAMIIEDRG